MFVKDDGFRDDHLLVSFGLEIKVDAFFIAAPGGIAGAIMGGGFVIEHEADEVLTADGHVAGDEAGGGAGAGEAVSAAEGEFVYICRIRIFD